jgi:predicted nucleic acid-binding protein
MSRLLLDVSAWARSRHPAVAERWRSLVGEGRLVCHPFFALELVHGATNPARYQQVRSAIDEGFDWLWPDARTADVALSIQQRMAANRPAGQRVKAVDLLTAALAIQHGTGVLHYDTDYDEIRKRGGQEFESEWIAAKGSLDSGTSRRRAARKTYRKAFGERMAQLRGDADLEVWPQLIEWLDEQLRARSLGVPPPAA